MDATFVFGVDLDGTCADFYGGLRPIAAEWLGVDPASLTSDVSWNLPEWGIERAPGGYKKLHQFAVTQRDLFRILKPMPGAPQVLRRLSAEHQNSDCDAQTLHQELSSRSGAADDRVARSPRHSVLGPLLPCRQSCRRSRSVHRRLADECAATTRGRSSNNYLQQLHQPPSRRSARRQLGTGVRTRDAGARELDAHSSRQQLSGE
jgi:hypothetical protein